MSTPRKKRSSRSNRADKSSPGEQPASRTIRNPNTKREIMVMGAILAGVFLAYVNSLGGEFVYDDQMQVLQNPTIRSLSMIPKMLFGSVWQFMNQSSGAPIGPYYRPLFNIALVINYHLFGFQAVGWHLVSLLFHLASTALVFLLSRRYGLNVFAAGIASTVFGLHPIHSESVAWVSGIPDPMAAVFILISLLAYERWRSSTKKSWMVLGLSAVLAFLAMLSKEIGVVIPAYIFVRELAADDAIGFRNSIRRAVIGSGIFFVTAAAYLGVRYAVLGSLAQSGPNAEGIPAVQVLFTIPLVLLRYAKLLIVPYPLSIVYDQTFVRSALEPRLWLGLTGIGAIVVGAILAMRRSVESRFAFALTVLFILPVLNLKTFRPEESLLHDRYVYVPSIGFSILVALAARWLVERSATRKRIVYGGVAAICAALFFLTVLQNRSWRNDAAMAENALTIYPHWPFMHNYLGARYYLSRNWSQAEREFREAIEARPNYADAYSNLGDSLSAQGRLAEAEQEYVKAIEYGVKYADTRFNLGIVYLNTNRLIEAEQSFNDALTIEPRHERARYSLGYLYDREGRTADAIAAYTKTLEYNPAYVDARVNLAKLLFTQNRYNDAIELLRVGIRYTPENPVLQYHVAEAFRLAGRYDEAISVFSQLQARDPQNAEIYAHLGLAYEGAGRQTEARACFDRALKLAPFSPASDIARDHLMRSQ